MNVRLEGIARTEVETLISRLEAESFPKDCKVALIEARSSSGATDRTIRIELATSLPGVLLPLPIPNEYVDWAATALIELAKSHKAS